MIRLKQTNYIFLNSFFDEVKSKREKMFQATKYSVVVSAKKHHPSDYL